MEAKNCLWESYRSGNPNKSWIKCGNKKLSALMSTAAARRIVEDHNRTVKYLFEKGGKS